MTRKSNKKNPYHNEVSEKPGANYKFDLLNSAQKMAWRLFLNHDIMFMTGVAGTGKTYLAMAFAIHELLNTSKNRIILTRPILESGEKLGFLPGDFEEKVHPYMVPLYDSIDGLCKGNQILKGKVNASIEIAPLAYLRGRSQPLDCDLITPDGIVKMGDIQIGDEVIGSNGKPIKVTGIFPQGKIDVYKVTFSDGTSTRCSLDHLWSTMTLSEKRHNKGYSVKSTKQIMENLKTKFNQKNHKVPILSSFVEFNEQEVPIDPYLLGIYLRNDKVDIFDDCNFNSDCLTKTKSSISLQALKELNLDIINSSSSFIPDLFKFNNTKIRKHLLKGLFNGKSRFISKSKQLTDDIVFLLRSLGKLNNVMQINNYYIVDLAKNKKVKLIKSIELVGQEECQCISVDSEDKLYLTDDFILTHNTFNDAICIFDEAQNASYAQLKLFVSRLGQNSKMIITNDPNQSDLVQYKDAPIKDFVNKIEGIEGIAHIEFKSDFVVRHPLVAKILDKLN